MFCSSCGKEIEENANFCSVCGAKITQIVESNPIIQMSSHNIYQNDDIQEIQIELTNIIEELKRVEEYHNRRQILQKQINGLERSGDSEFILLKLGISIPIGIFLGFLIGILGVGMGLSMSFILHCMWIIGVLTFGILHFCLKDTMKNRKNKRIEKLQTELHTVRQVHAESVQKVVPVLQRNLPREYWYSIALTSITGYLRTGRASNMKEALNLYEEEMHRLRMENMQEQSLRLNQQAATYSAITAANSSILVAKTFFK